MTSRSQRPLSAIFLGTPDKQLPSPPHTISTTSSGSAGDGGKTVPKTPARHLPDQGRKASMEILVERRSESRGSLRRESVDLNSNDEDDDDENPDDNEDHTARLSNDQRLSHTQEASSSSTSSRPRLSLRRTPADADKPKTLLDRTRKTFERLSSPRLSSLSPSPRTSTNRATSPLPPGRTRSSAGPSTSSSRSPFTRVLPDIEGSETERGAVYSSSDDLSTTPPTSAPARRTTHLIAATVRDTARERVLSVPSPPRPQHHTRPTQPARPDSNSGTLSRRDRRATLQTTDAGENIFADAVAAATGARKSPRRTPLPQEFRDRRSIDGRTNLRSQTGSPEIPTIRPPSSLAREREREQPVSPAVLVARGLPDVTSSTAALSSRPVSPRAQRTATRSSTVRESSSTGRRQLLHSRWASEDVTMDSPGADVDEEGRKLPYRYETRGASAESALVNGLRGDNMRNRLVDESLRAAGLSRRKEKEDIFTLPTDSPPQRRHQRAVTVGDNVWDEVQRVERPSSRLDPRPPSRAGAGDRPPSRADLGEQSRTPASAGVPGSNRPRSLQALVGSRPATSMGAYPPDDAPRTAHTPLRTYYSSLNLPERALNSSPRPGAERSFDSPLRTVLPLATPSVQNSTLVHGGSEHTRLLLDALAMFESHYSRLNASQDVLRSAQSIVQSANALNTLLRAASASALEEQIEADVASSSHGADVDPNASVAEVWKRVGSDYRDSLKISDDLVRSMTGFMLSIGRTLREGLSSGALAHGRGEDTMSRLSDGTPSRVSDHSGRRSIDGRGSVEGRGGDGRRSVEGSRVSSVDRRGGDFRRSLDGEVLRRAATAVGRGDTSVLNGIASRPGTSMSIARERGGPDHDVVERVRERELQRDGEWERHRLSRLTETSSQESPSPAQPASTLPPTNAPSTSTPPSTQERAALSSSRRYFPSRQPVDSPLSPTEARRLHRLAIPPPLPSLPSESLATKDKSVTSSGSKSPRRNKMPASPALRGSAIVSLGTPSPTTHLTTATVSVSQDTSPPTAFHRAKTYSFSLSRATGRPSTADGAGEGREQRKRTLSTASATYGEDEIFVPPNAKGASIRVAPDSPQRLRSSRARMSLDGRAGTNKTVARINSEIFN